MREKPTLDFRTISETVSVLSKEEMGQILQKIPPLEGIFDPEEEIKNMRSKEAEEKKKELPLFKDKLARQREAWALCRNILEDKFYANPEMSQDALNSIIDSFASAYGFPEKHIATAKALVKDFGSQRQRMLNARREYPDDIELINRLAETDFAERDRENLLISMGPISFEILCNQAYANRLYAACSSKEGYSPGGFAAETKDPKPTFFLVLNTELFNDSTTRNSAIDHERTHQENKLLLPKLSKNRAVSPRTKAILDSKNKTGLLAGVLGFLRKKLGRKNLPLERDLRQELLDGYKESENSAEKEILLAELFKLDRDVLLEDAKDELLAMEIYGGLFLSSEVFFSEGPYDYVNKYASNLRSDGLLFNKLFEEILVEEYRSVIEKARDAIFKLSCFGYDKKEVIALLTDKKLEEWPKTVDRLIREKRIRNWKAIK